jgi:DNA-binding MarR family transcriptional regulator
MTACPGAVLHGPSQGWRYGRAGHDPEEQEDAVGARPDEQRLAAWRDLLLAHDRIMRELERDLTARTEINLAQYDVLLRLSEAPRHRMRMRDLADAVLYSTGGFTRLFERMHGAGLVSREPSAEDRRVVFAGLTAHGRRTLRAASQVHLDGIKRQFADLLDDDELEAVTSFLARLRAAATQGTRSST